jgi:Kelch motif
VSANSSGRRLLNLAIVAVLGVAIGVGGYLAYLWVMAPAPRAAAGWTLLTEMPEPRGETAAAVAGDRLFVVGGMAGVLATASVTVSAYDLAAGSWAAGPPLPETRHHLAAVGHDGAVYVSGGAAAVTDGTPRAEAWVLDAGTTAWRAIAPMPGGRFGHRMVALEGLVWAVGGLPGPGTAAGEPVPTLAYDPATEAWQEQAPLPLNRDHLAVVVIDGEIWALGGRAGGTNHERVDIYDPTTDTWRDGPPLPEAVSGASEGAVGSVILLSGGEDPGAGRMVDRHWWLDVADGDAASWRDLPPPPLTVHGAPGAVLGGRFIVVSGSPRPGGQSSTAWTGATQALDGLPVD